MGVSNDRSAKPCHRADKGYPLVKAGFAGASILNPALRLEQDTRVAVSWPTRRGPNPMLRPGTLSPGYRVTHDAVLQ
jgi:hypothetical protein